MERPGPVKPLTRNALLLSGQAVFLLAVLTACAPRSAPKGDDGAALRDAGYVPAPRFTKVETLGASFVLSGEASQSARVGIQFIGSNATGQTMSQVLGTTADEKGAFRVEVPSGVTGGLYNLFNDDRGRQMHAEGRLFVPVNQPAKAVVLRPGGASLPLGGNAAALATADYDSAGGLAVAGQVAPDTLVELTVDGIVIGQARSDAAGRYRLSAQIAPPGDTQVTLELNIAAGRDHASEVLPVSRPIGQDRVTQLEQAWRVDWKLPGGGVQTTIVF